MTQVPTPSGKELFRFLRRQGFALTHIRGSHHYLQKGQKKTAVPIHGNKSLKPKTFRNILRDIDMSIQNFLELW